jgi:uncharacterized protein
MSDTPITAAATPLNNAEIESLADVLNRFAGACSMNIEKLDGFLAAVVCCPDEVQKFEYLPEIWGDQMINEDSFAEQALLQDFLSLVDRHRLSILHTLQTGDVFTPVLLAGPDGKFPGNDWANGFVRGMTFCKEEWSALFEDEGHGGSLVPIFALAHEHDPDPAMRPYKEPMTEERRETLIICAAAGVMNIYKYFRRGYVGAKSEPPHHDATYRRLSPKTGRNDPCPCGSGKKFKHCCFNVTFH